MSKLRYPADATRSPNGCIIGPGPWCGTAGGYTNHYCRCAACTAAWQRTHLAYMDAHPEQLAKHRLREAERRGGYKIGPGATGPKRGSKLAPRAN